MLIAWRSERAVLFDMTPACYDGRSKYDALTQTIFSGCRQY